MMRSDVMPIWVMIGRIASIVMLGGGYIAGWLCTIFDWNEDFAFAWKVVHVLLLFFGTIAAICVFFALAWVYGR